MLETQAPFLMNALRHELAIDIPPTTMTPAVLLMPYTDICTGDQFIGSCPRGEVLVINHAEYGRMEPGRCGITSEGGHIGCSNDILYLADRKCSGRRECDFMVGTTEFNEANTECRELRAYMRISYSCIKVVYDDQGPCLTYSPSHITSHEGFIGSYVTDETGCGSPRAPWVITAMPGQTIDLWLLDFGALSRDNMPYQSLCFIYGYIVERPMGVNKTICGGMLREESMYSSKSSTVEIHIIPRGQRQDDNCFVISYEVIGCSDLTPPANAYFKRQGKDAVVGCYSSDSKWHLKCQGDRWDGVVGNCSARSNPQASFQTTHLAIIVAVAVVVTTAIIAVTVLMVKQMKYGHSQTSMQFGPLTAASHHTADVDPTTAASHHTADVDPTTAASHHTADVNPTTAASHPTADVNPTTAACHHADAQSSGDSGFRHNGSRNYEEIPEHHDSRNYEEIHTSGYLSMDNHQGHNIEDQYLTTTKVRAPNIEDEYLTTTDSHGANIDDENPTTTNSQDTNFDDE